MRGVSLARMPWLPTAAVAALGVVMMIGQVALRPTQVALGADHSEGPIHLWSLWVTTQGLAENGPFLRVADIMFPHGFRAHLMDPINLVFFAPFYALAGGGPAGAALGWNVMHVAWVLVGAYGCWRLGRWISGDHVASPWATALLALVVCLGPRALDAPFSGRTELLPALLYPLHLALLAEWLRVPRGLVGAVRAPTPRLAVGVGAGLTLGLLANGGWYIAVFAALVNVGLGLWMAWGLPLKEATLRLALVTGIAGLLLIPAAMALASAPDTHGGIFSSDWSPGEITHRSYPVYGLSELFHLQRARTTAPWLDQVPYVSLLVLALGMMAAFLYRRVALGWTLVGFAALFAAMGPLFLVTWDEGQNLDLVTFQRSPIWVLMRAVPILTEIHSWSRMVWIAIVPLGVAASLGLLAVSAIFPRHVPHLTLGLGALIFTDHLHYPHKVTIERPVFEIGLPEPYRAAIDALPPGALIHVPFSSTLSVGGDSESPVQRYLFWQLQHGRPISASFSKAGDSARSNSFAMSIQRRLALAKDAYLRGRAPRALEVDEIACARAGLTRLRQMGFAGVLVHLDLSRSATVRDDMTQILGEPAFDDGNLLIWPITEMVSPALLTLMEGACDE